MIFVILESLRSNNSRLQLDFLDLAMAIRPNLAGTSSVRLDLIGSTDGLSNDHTIADCGPL